MFNDPLYVVGDIHGCYDKLTNLYKKIIDHRDIYNLEGKAALCFVGDYIDRGPDSEGVLSFIRKLTLKIEDNGWLNVVPLKGNHEAMAYDDYRCWIMNGGVQTYESFGTIPEDYLTSELGRWTKRFSNYYILNSVAVTHAGIDCEDLPVEQHSEDALLWSRKLRMHPHNIYKYSVHGHTPMKEAIVDKHVAYIDTGAVFGEKYKLTALFIADTVDPNHEDMRLIQV